MTMIQTHEQVYGGEEYLGFARQKLSVLDAIRRGSSLPTMCRVYEFGSARITVVSADVGNLIRIESSMGGFICHPRDDTNPGGAKPGGVAITPTYAYPLVDDDHGSRVLTYENDAWTVTSEVENYGNLDWMGPDGNVLTWRGPAGRQFPMDSTINYPGFTFFDYESGGIEHFTPFKNIVYQSGNVLKEFPENYKVTGCAFNGGSLVCVVNVDYTGQTNPDNGTGGFYDEVYVEDERIGWAKSSRPTMPWFFSPSGSEAVSGNRKLVLDGAGSVTFTELTSGNGTETVSFSKGEESRWSLSASGAWELMRDYRESALAHLDLTISVNENTAGTGGSDDTYEDLPIMWSCSDTPYAGYISGPNPAAVGSTYSFTLTSGNPSACPTITWSFDKGTISSSGVIQSITGCGGGTISCTYEDDCYSVEATLQVRLPVGKWVNTYVGHVGCYVTGSSRDCDRRPYCGSPETPDTWCKVGWAPDWCRGSGYYCEVYEYSGWTKNYTSWGSRYSAYTHYDLAGVTTPPFSDAIAVYAYTEVWVCP